MRHYKQEKSAGESNKPTIVLKRVKYIQQYSCLENPIDGGAW